jgi:hypothetical protein
LVKLTLLTRPSLLNYKQLTTTSPLYAQPHRPPIVARYQNALRQTRLPHPYRARYAVIRTRAGRALNYYIPINISIKHIEGIILRKTVRGLYNNLYPLYA